MSHSEPFLGWFTWTTKGTEVSARDPAVSGDSAELLSVSTAAATGLREVAESNRESYQPSAHPLPQPPKEMLQ